MQQQEASKSAEWWCVWTPNLEMPHTPHFSPEHSICIQPSYNTVNFILWFKKEIQTLVKEVSNNTSTR
jgi:hypothetical protein